MTSHLKALEIRRRLGRRVWQVPVEFGPDGWRFDHATERTRILVSYGPTGPGSADSWVHASISHADRMPEYSDLVTLHAAVWQGDGYAYQVFAPKSQHVNIHPYALHLWGRLDGRPELPEFGARGSI